MHIATTTISPETFLAIMTVAAIAGTAASLAARAGIVSAGDHCDRHVDPSCPTAAS